MLEFAKYLLWFGYSTLFESSLEYESRADMKHLKIANFKEQPFGPLY